MKYIWIIVYITSTSYEVYWANEIGGKEAPRRIQAMKKTKGLLCAFISFINLDGLQEKKMISSLREMFPHRVGLFN